MKPRHKLFFILPLAILHGKDSFSSILNTLFLKKYVMKDAINLLRENIYDVAAILKLKHECQNCLF